MPLPTGNTTWPPATHATIFSDMQTWEAWWSGDTMKLWNLYHGKAAANTTQTRGLLGFASRFFWGRKTTSGNMPSRSDLHIPIASDICATSADLLYATPPHDHHAQPGHKRTDRTLHRRRPLRWASRKRGNRGSVRWPIRARHLG